MAAGQLNNRVVMSDSTGRRKKNKEDEQKENNYGYGGSTGAGGYSFSGESYKAPSYSYSVKGYDPASDKAYQQALSALQGAYGNTPTYTPTYDAQINDIYNQIMNRGKFKYSLSSDPLYQEAREQYVGQGQMAMMNTMGKAAALTGGYGSSYSQAGGPQQYNAYLQSLGELVPEYYDRAFNQWQAEGSDLYNKYGLTKDLADTEYSKYRDQMSDYWNNVDYLANQENSAYNRGFENHWNTENANMSNFWNSTDIANTNYWKSQEMAFDNYWKSVSAALSQQKAAGSSTGSNKYSSSQYKQFVENLDNIKGLNLTNRGQSSRGQSSRGQSSLVSGVIAGAKNVVNGQATAAARAREINAAVMSGKISEDDADLLLKKYGISADYFDKVNGYR